MTIQAVRAPAAPLPGGGWLLRSRDPLAPYAPRINAQELRGRALAAPAGLVRDLVGSDREGGRAAGLPRRPRHGGRRRVPGAAAGGSSSRSVARAILLAEPPSLDAGEVTDKGSLNVRAIQARRAADLETLYANHPEVITP
jgi:feruloyl-CoA synthase